MNENYHCYEIQNETHKFSLQKHSVDWSQEASVQRTVAIIRQP
jgi:hypothetical protein